jgi:aryl-alcohol dehydrogenase-like predicted oxidoreductase
MRTRALGKTGIQVSELALGTWGLSGDAYGPVPDGEARRVMDRALAMGVTLFETADTYGAGKMESELGEALKGAEVTIVTKWGTDLEGSPTRKRFDDDFLKKSAEASRKRLGDKAKIIGMLHNPSAEALEKRTGLDALKKLADEGAIASFGVSVGDEKSARAAIAGEVPLLSIPYNILHVSCLRSVEEAIKEAGTGVLAHSVLFYGLLAGRWAPNKDFRSYDHRAERWGQGSLRQRIGHLDAVRPLVSGDVTTMRSAAVRFVLQNALISSAILGPRTGAQIDQLIRECRAEPPYLSAGKMSSLEGRLSELDVPR